MIAVHPVGARIARPPAGRSEIDPYRASSNIPYGKAAISSMAWMAASTSSQVVKYPKLKRTAPCSTVPRAWCILGAQWAPARVAMP